MSSEAASTNSGSPLVSVIIPTHNRRQLLEEAVQSCLHQVYPSIEIIVVDDGSTDGTDALVNERLASAWAGRVQYYWQTHSGASAARNRGLAVARGEFVQFLDSDDVLLPRKIELQLACLTDPDSRYSGCSCFGRGGRREKNGVRLTNRIGVQRSDPVAYVREMCGTAAHVMQTAAPLWRRDFLLAGAGWREDIGFGDDWEYYVRLLVRAEAIGFVDAELFLVLGHEGPRLGWGNLGREQVLSGFRAQRSVLETVARAGALNKSVHDGLMRRARSTYILMLGVGADSDIREYEQWLLRVSRRPAFRLLPHMTVAGRRLLGRRALLLAHSAYSGARTWVRAAYGRSQRER